MCELHHALTKEYSCGLLQSGNYTNLKEENTATKKGVAKEIIGLN